MGEWDKLTINGSSRLGPRRFTNSSATLSRPGRTAMRRGAGDVSLALASGLNMKNSVSDVCAARCSRRSDSGRTWVCQNSRAPKLPARKICSADHNASAVFVARSTLSAVSGKPQYAAASGWNRWGAWSNAIGRRATARRAGNSKRNSPMPGCWTSKSVREPFGHPRPGNSCVTNRWVALDLLLLKEGPFEPSVGASKA